MGVGCQMGICYYYSMVLCCAKGGREAGEGGRGLELNFFVVICVRI